MTPRYVIKATVSGRGENMQQCPICHHEVKTSEGSCPGCGYKFPATGRRSRLHRDSLISFPHAAESGAGKDLIFL